MNPQHLKEHLGELVLIVLAGENRTCYIGELVANSHDIVEVRMMDENDGSYQGLVGFSPSRVSEIYSDTPRLHELKRKIDANAPLSLTVTVPDSLPPLIDNPKYKRSF